MVGSRLNSIDVTKAVFRSLGASQPVPTESPLAHIENPSQNLRLHVHACSRRFRCSLATTRPERGIEELMK